MAALRARRRTSAVTRVPHIPDEDGAPPPEPVPVDPRVVADRRRIRASAYATTAWFAFLIWAARLGGWEVLLDGLGVSFILTLSVAVALFRGNLAVACIAGLFGIYQFGVAVWAIGWVLTGGAAAANMGPSIMRVYFIGIPFAVVWLRGGLAAVRLMRAARKSRRLAI